GVMLNQYPAKYTFDLTTSVPDCIHDHAVYPVNVAPAVGSQPNIIGFHMLYSGTVPNPGVCNPYLHATPNPPSAEIYYSYAVGTGPVLTSPVISLDGLQIAFVETRRGSTPIFHVLNIHPG